MIAMHLDSTLLTLWEYHQYPLWINIHRATQKLQRKTLLITSDLHHNYTFLEVIQCPHISCIVQTVIVGS